MEDMISGMVEKCGISEDQAKKVFSFLKDNASKIPGWIGEVDSVEDAKDKVVDGIKSFF